MTTQVAQGEAVRALVQRALTEDRASCDATSLATVPATSRAHGRIEARAEGVLAGVEYATAAFRACDPEVELSWERTDGDAVRSGLTVLRCAGRARGLLAAERTALNFLQQLSGVATATAQLVAAAGDVRVLDTRKTLPGLRDAQRAAVRAGGGVSHRHDLEDQLLLKENHFALSGRSYGETVARAVEAAGGRVVGAEAQTEGEALAALNAGASYVLLDNFADEELAAVVATLRAEHPEAVLEASGTFDLERVARIRDSGVDRVSVGRITHSAVALDLSFLLEAGE